MYLFKQWTRVMVNSCWSIPEKISERALTHMPENCRRPMGLFRSWTLLKEAKEKEHPLRWYQKLFTGTTFLNKHCGWTATHLYTLLPKAFIRFSIFVHLSTITKYHRLGGLKTREIFFLTILEAENYQINWVHFLVHRQHILAVSCFSSRGGEKPF